MVRNPKLYSKVAVPFCTLTSNEQKFCCSTSSLAFSVGSVLHFGHLKGHLKGVLWHCSFNFCFTDNIICQASFIWSLHLSTFFSEDSVKIFDLFLIRLFSYHLVLSICVFFMNLLYQMYLCKYFLSVCGLSFLSLDTFFCRAKPIIVIILVKSNLLILSFMDCFFGIVSRIYHHIQGYLGLFNDGLS